MNSSGYRSDEGRRIKWEGDFKRHEREPIMEIVCVWEGGALVKGNQPGTLEPNQRPFFAVKPNKK